MLELPFLHHLPFYLNYFFILVILVVHVSVVNLNYVTFCMLMLLGARKYESLFLNSAVEFIYSNHLEERNLQITLKSFVKNIHILYIFIYKGLANMRCYFEYLFIIDVIF